MVYKRGIVIMNPLVIPWENLSSSIIDCFSQFNLRFKKNERVLLKPNLVAPRTSTEGVTTSLELIESLIVFLKNVGVDVVVGEGVGYEFSSKTFEILKIDQLCSSHRIPFIDFRDEKIKTEQRGKFLIPKIIYSFDKIINLPKPKTHMITTYSGAMKNLIGILPLSERRRIHIMNIEKGIYDLSKVIPISLNIADWSTTMLGSGPTYGDVYEPKKLVISDNMYLLDRYCCKQMGISLTSVEHIRLALNDLPHEKSSYDTISINLPKIKVPKKGWYRIAYRLIYFLDYLLESIGFGSLIKYIIPRVGTHPIISAEKFSVLTKAEQDKIVKACPVGAINRNGKIILRICSPIRCLKCYGVNSKVISITGISKPIK
jgi:uncharacterized protein (DUF362 family)